MAACTICACADTYDLNMMQMAAVHMSGHTGVAIAEGTCVSSKTRDTEGYDCTQYSTNAAGDWLEYCKSRAYDDSDFTPSVSCCECGGGSQAPTMSTYEDSGARHRAAVARGDPHLQNILGQRFDLMVPGMHTLINIPRGGSVNTSMLHITADAQKAQTGDAGCGELYFQALNVTGQWLDQRRPLHFFAGGAQNRDETKWMTFGGVGVKVVHGLTLTGIPYLNLMVRNLKKSGFTIGGLLGEDSHDIEATSSPWCKNIMSLYNADNGDKDADIRSEWLAIAE